MFVPRSFLFFIGMVLSLISLAQEPRGTVSGTVVDVRSGIGLVDAAVLLEPSEPLIGTTTDSLGRFVLEQVPVGLYTARVRLLGHETLLVPEVWVRSGKETVLPVVLSPSFVGLETFTVTAMAREEVEPLGVRSFTVEQGLRYPAMFQDPARLVMSTPGVAAANDQANHLIVRGNSPNANAWLIEVGEIVSPNHLGNAGTPTDLPTLSGGGVNILSAQMLGPSRLRTGVSPIAYSNALGGLMDMELRRGNTREREWTAQAGLIGLDLSTEGPIGKIDRAFYLVNYRYSTLGILSAMGVDLGDEAIAFQDLSFHVGTKVGKRGEVRLFGMGGMSSNIFEADRDTATWEFDKDSHDITYTANMGAVGSTLRLPLGERSTLSSTVAWSAAYQERDDTNYGTDLEPIGRSIRGLYESKLSVLAQVDASVGSRFRYGYGGSAMERRVENLFEQEVAGWLIRPFVHLRFDVTEHLQATAGLAYSHFTYNGSELVEPRAGLRWRMAKGRSIGINYGVRGQLPYHQLLNMTGFVTLPSSTAVGLMRSDDIVLGYDHAVSERLSFRVEVYQQLLARIPVLAPGVNIGQPESFGSVNVWDEPQLLPQVSSGDGKNTGVEPSLNRAFDRGWFFQANGTFYQSTYTLVGGVESDSRWNGRWMTNAMGGREWRKAKEDRVRTWGVSARVFAMGGLRYTPIEVRVRDGEAIPTITAAPWSEQLGDVFRADLRVYRKMDRNGRTGQWALDLQNVSNARNEAYRSFDARQGAVVTKYQLGLIPNISYRIEF
jgi:hypothetical protein